MPKKAPLCIIFDHLPVMSFFFFFSSCGISWTEKVILWAEIKKGLPVLHSKDYLYCTQLESYTTSQCFIFCSWILYSETGVSTCVAQYFNKSLACVRWWTWAYEILMMFMQVNICFLLPFIFFFQRSRLMKILWTDSVVALPFLCVWSKQSN